MLRYWSASSFLSYLLRPDIPLFFGSVVCRFGGDEFVLILPETDLEGAKICVERLKATVNGRQFGPSPLSITVGIAALQPGMSSVNLLEEADRGLYAEKLEKAN